MLINFFGKRGSGKTTTINGQLPNCKSPCVVVDILGNFNDSEYLHTSSISEACELINSEINDPINKPIVLKTGDPDLAVDFMSAALWEANGGTLVLDECDAFSFSDAPCFNELISYGRNRNVDLITGCRRPAELHRNITAGANKLFAFQTQEPRDIQYFESTVFGKRAEKLMYLKPFHGLYLDYDKGTFGEYRIDKLGNLFILSSSPINKDIENSRSEKPIENQSPESTDESGMGPEESIEHAAESGIRRLTSAKRSEQQDDSIESEEEL